MSLVFQPKIEIKAKHLYILIAVLVLSTGVFFASAYGTDNPSNFGHTVGEIEDAVNKSYVDSQAGIAGANYFDDAVSIDSVGEGESSSGTIDVSSDPDLSDDATVLLLRTRVYIDQSNNGKSEARIKHPSHSSWKTIARTIGTDSDQTNDAVVWYGLEDGKLDYHIENTGSNYGGSVVLQVYGEIR